MSSCPAAELSTNDYRSFSADEVAQDSLLQHVGRERKTLKAYLDKLELSLAAQSTENIHISTYDTLRQTTDLRRRRNQEMREAANTLTDAKDTIDDLYTELMKCYDSMKKQASNQEAAASTSSHQQTGHNPFTPGWSTLWEDSPALNPCAHGNYHFSGSRTTRRRCRCWHRGPPSAALPGPPRYPSLFGRRTHPFDCQCMECDDSPPVSPMNANYGMPPIQVSQYPGYMGPGYTMPASALNPATTMGQTFGRLGLPPHLHTLGCRCPGCPPAPANLFRFQHPFGCQCRACDENFFDAMNHQQHIISSFQGGSFVNSQPVAGQSYADASYGNPYGTPVQNAPQRLGEQPITNLRGYDDQGREIRPGLGQSVNQGGTEDLHNAPSV